MGEVVGQKFWTGKRIALTVIIWMAAAISVVVAMILINGRVDYTGARENIAGILETKPAVERFLDADVKSLDFTDEEKGKMADFEAALEQCESKAKELKESAAMKDNELKAKYDAIEGDFDMMARLMTTWSEVKMLTDLTDENLATLKKSENEKIRALAEDFGSYRAEVESFKKQYTENAKKSSSVIEAYGQLQVKGDELSKKYASLSLKDITGVTKVDILSFYDRIEELNQYVRQK